MIVQCVSCTSCEACKEYDDEPLDAPVVGRYYTVEKRAEHPEKKVPLFRLAELPLPLPWYHCSCNFRPVEDADDKFLTLIEELQHRVRHPDWQKEPMKVDA
jgi:hypothetical protein